jgi:hypothetical protein
MSNVKVNLFTTETEPIGEYYAPAVPREGESLNYEGVLYQVKTVTWEGLPHEPAVQIRLEQ